MYEKNIVAIVIVDKKNRILLQDRTSISKYGEEWSFFGWHMEHNESIVETAQREASEELHIFLWKKQIHYIGTTIHYLRDKNIQYTRHICLIPVKDITDLNLKDYEWSGANIFSISKIDNLKFNTDISQEKNLIIYHMTHYIHSDDFSSINHI
jgi:8-oxo-dGTP pyrophosphatase MutT (NUDIX family)